MKKKLLIGLGIVAASAALVGGTFAYLTDSQKDENVFTIGNVDIDLYSKVNSDEPIKLMPNNSEKVKADYQIANIGNEDAYVWLRVKVPAALEDVPGAAADNIIHWNYLGAYWYGYQDTQRYIDSAVAQNYEAPVPAERTWKHLDGVQVTIDEEVYNVYDILYAGKLGVDEVTTVGISTIYMDQRVDYIDVTDNNEDDGFWTLVKDGGTVLPINHDFNDGANFLVEAHAIQANGFATVEEAYAAYNAQWANNED